MATESWIPHPELHRADSLTERMHRYQCFEGEIGLRVRTTIRKANFVIWGHQVVAERGVQMPRIQAVS